MNGRQIAQIITQETLLKCNNFFTVRRVKCCNRMLREGVKSPFLEIYLTGQGPEQPTAADPAPSRELDYLISRAPLQPPILWGDPRILLSIYMLWSMSGKEIIYSSIQVGPLIQIRPKVFYKQHKIWNTSRAIEMQPILGWNVEQFKSFQQTEKQQEPKHAICNWNYRGN